MVEYAVVLRGYKVENPRLIWTESLLVVIVAHRRLSLAFPTRKFSILARVEA